MNRSRGSFFLVLLSTFWLSLAGCAIGIWGASRPTDVSNTYKLDSNGMVFSLGPSVWQAAGQEISQVLETTGAYGILFDNTSSLNPGGIPLMSVDYAFSWGDGTIYPGTVDLEASPLGLDLEIAVSLDPLFLDLDIGGQKACALLISELDGVLAARLTLTQTKHGVVQASLNGEPTLDPFVFTIDILDEYADGCSDVLNDPAANKLLMEMLANASFMAMSPELVNAIPAALGLDIATALSMVYGDDGIGSGVFHAVVRAPHIPQAQWWHFVDNNLVVPFSVGIQAEAHACVPDQPLPQTSVAAVPATDGEISLLIHQGVIQRSAAAIWRSGGLCMMRAAPDVSWPASDFLDSWPSLSWLGDTAEITMRAWPKSMPELVFETRKRGEVHVRISTGSWTIELFSEKALANVRLATLDVAMEVVAKLDISPEGELWLLPQEVSVLDSKESAGLLPAPRAELADSLAVSIAERLLGANPVWLLPPLPTGSPDQVDLLGAYLVFTPQTDT
jgi:hypothetical protein